MTAVLHSELTTKRLRVWGVRSGQSIIDQGVSSGAGFILNLCLARWLDSEAYGGFAVAFTTLLFLFGFHGALLLEPMSVIGPSEYTDNITRYFVAQVKLHCIVTLVLSVILLLTAAIVAATGLPFSLVSSLAGSGFALPFLLLLWMVRRMCYVVRRPSLALLGSIGYLFFITLGLVILRAGGLLGPFSAFLLMGAASIPPALYVLKELGVSVLFATISP